MSTRRIHWLFFFLFFLVNNLSVYLCALEGKKGLIVFSYNSSDAYYRYKICLMDEEGGNRKRLTDGPGVDRGPVWSPDGTRIAFHSNRDTGRLSEIFIMNADGSNLKKVVSQPGCTCGSQEWTPDGNYLIFTIEYGTNDNSIFKVKTDGVLNSGFSPVYNAHAQVGFWSISPNGEKLTFSGYAHPPNHYLFMIDTQQPIEPPISTGGRSDWNPSPNQILYIPYNGLWSIVKLDIDTGEEKFLTEENPIHEYYLDPHWSMPIPEKIIYNCLGNIWIMDADGNNKKQLTEDAIAAEGSGELYYFDSVVTLTQIYIDIKPQSCPNPINVKSKGVLPVAILGTEDFDVTTIDPESIQLAGVNPIRNSVGDVSTPVMDKNEVCNCTTELEDGIDDLLLKFDTQEIVGVLGQVTDGEELELTLTGELYDGTNIEGKDCIIVISKGK